MAPPAEEYLGAFLDGYEFLLLAFEGRLSGEEPEDLEEFLEDYHRILELHRRHLESDEAEDELVPVDEFPATLHPQSEN